MKRGWKVTKVILESYFCFGKHRGKTIKWLIENDIEYLTWCLTPQLQPSRFPNQKNYKQVIKWDYSRRPNEAKIAEEYYLNKLTQTN